MKMIVPFDSAASRQPVTDAEMKAHRQRGKLKLKPEGYESATLLLPAEGTPLSTPEINMLTDYSHFFIGVS